MGERAGTGSSNWAALRQLAGRWRVFLFTGLAWLFISVIVLRFTPGIGRHRCALVGVVVLAVDPGGGIGMVENPLAIWSLRAHHTSSWSRSLVKMRSRTRTGRSGRRAL
jgi:hypothetical protein